MTLSKLKHGDRAIIISIGDDDANSMARLAARGIVPGTQIGVLQAGDPLLIGIDNERWALNRFEAATIEVDLLERPRRRLAGLFRRS